MTTARCPQVVMVVEDDSDVRESISEVLEDNDYHAVEASNGREALERLRADDTKPCVILLDVMMPVMDGWQFRTAQKDDPDLQSIPVVVLSAHVNARKTATAMNVAGYLQKPVDLESLLEVVKRHCTCGAGGGS
jgi:CheY-like chemotaxis protein